VVSYFRNNSKSRSIQLAIPFSVLIEFAICKGILSFNSYIPTDELKHAFQVSEGVNAFNLELLRSNLTSDAPLNDFIMQVDRKSIQPVGS